jgi:hypothetical protein
VTAPAIVPEHVITQEFRTPVAVRRGMVRYNIALVLVGGTTP